jgi:transcriptional regulator with XRE-family HTH domain
MTIGTKIKNRREELGMTQSELAEKIKITQPGLSLIESGKNNPSAPLLIVIAMQLNLPSGELLHIRDERRAV